MSRVRSFTPREIVGELDRYIVGQGKAKRAVAIALRNRWRRQKVEPGLRDEIAPKNIIMIGATGVGKTEIARRLAKLARAPFVKVEASKFTEVGYVGRDVESMIRDLVEIAMNMVREEEKEGVNTRVKEHAEERLVDLIVRSRRGDSATEVDPSGDVGTVTQAGAQLFPFIMNQSGQPIPAPAQASSATAAPAAPTRDELDAVRNDLRAGKLEDERIEIEVTDNQNPFMTIFGAQGMEEMEVNLRDMMGQLPGARGRTKPRKVPVEEARTILEEQEAGKLIDMDRVQREAIQRTEQAGIVFLDEIDKIAGRQTGKGGGPDVSREGVQRDLLPVVEGSTVSTKYGQVKTDHILFIAAGAFHLSAVSDLIPELQGRFPIRVELDSLEKKDFIRILTEPKNALTKQYEALMGTEGIQLSFEEDAIEAIAGYAAEANERAENIGARRLHTILEALLDELSFTAPERGESSLAIDAKYVQETLDPIIADEDLAKYIL